MKNICIFNSASETDDEISLIPDIISSSLNKPDFFENAINASANEHSAVKVIDKCLNDVSYRLSIYCPTDKYFGVRKDDKGNCIFPQSVNISFIESALRSHCIILSLYTSLYIKYNNDRISIHSLLTKRENNLEIAMDPGTVRKNYNSLRKNNDFNYLVDFSLSRKNTLLTPVLWSEYSLKVACCFSNVKRLYRAPSLRKSTVNSSFDALKKLEMELTSEICEPKYVANEAIRKLLHRYLTERYFYFDLIKELFHLTKLMLDSSSDSSLPKLNVEELTYLVSLTKYLPNVFSRMSFLKFALDSRFNNYLRSNIYNLLNGTERDPILFFKTITPRAFILDEWRILFKEFINRKHAIH